MIDLTKPIRHKHTKHEYKAKPTQTVAVWPHDESSTSGWVLDAKELERDYENIPEGRVLSLEWTSSGEHPNPPDVIEFRTRDTDTSKYSIMGYRKEK